MNIELTPEQFKTLAKAVYLGNWMANAQRTGKPGDEHLKEYDDITDHIFSLAPQFGFSKDFEHQLECGDHKNLTEITKLQDQYDEEVFWAEFCERIGKREFARKYSKDAIRAMTDEEYLIKLDECVSPIEAEIEKYGLDRVMILQFKTAEKRI